ncbi:hypothetical protein FRC01_000290 [Tulasnella sp. 417]|nr:hypothetical protein FRC01_000290 [Tulasnella sp. 417]
MCGPEGDHSHHDAGSSPRSSQFDSSQRKPRTLILCFDGTNDKFDETSTNIIRLFAALEKGRPNEQLVYYQPGIGTYVRPEAPGLRVIRSAAKKIDQAFAWYLGIHVGLLPRSNSEHVDFAYTLYENTDPESVKRAKEFKKTFSVHVEVEFIGVWDTVASVGVSTPTLPFNDSETFVRTFRHALAIDECRAKFQPNPWKYRKECKCGGGGRTQTDGFKTIEELNGSQHATCEGNSSSLCWCKDDKNYHGGQLTNVQEVWFPGFHADVGGGNDKNDVRDTLANPSLRWMVIEILKNKAGVIFNKDAFEDRLPRLAAKVKAFQNGSPLPTSYVDAKLHHHHGHTSEATAVNEGVMTPPVTPGSSYIKKTHEMTNGASPQKYTEPTEREEANGKGNNMLVDKPLWRILEWLPLTQTWIDDNGREVEGRRFNWARPRTIYHPEPLFHTSVRHRMMFPKPKESEDEEDRPPYNPLKQCKNPKGVKYIHEDIDQALSEDAATAFICRSH